jgi:hypothetical protein
MRNMHSSTSVQLWATPHCTWTLTVLTPPLQPVRSIAEGVEFESWVSVTTAVSTVALALICPTLHQHPERPQVLCIDPCDLLDMGDEDAARQLLWLHEQLWRLLDRKVAGGGGCAGPSKEEVGEADLIGAVKEVLAGSVPEHVWLSAIAYQHAWRLNEELELP